MREAVQFHWQLEVYQLSVRAAMPTFELTKSFPKQETYSLTDQIRRSSRSVSSNIAETWRKRRYKNAFISKLNDSEAEAAETQTWLEYSVKCDYIFRPVGEDLHREYDKIIGKLVTLIYKPDPWILPSPNTP